MSVEDLMQRLPHDLLADVLCRLQAWPHSLAAFRCVCKAWCTVVDALRLLTDIIPHPLSGMFVHLGDQTPPKYFSLMPPTKITSFDYLDTEDAECLMITQHCNGLLLLGDEEARVLNPATQEWATLPSPPPMCTPGMEDMYDVEDCMHCHDQCLVFDPIVSPHYEVFLTKHVPWIPTPDSYQLVDRHIKEREWPPSTFVLLVFSSRTNQWEERPFYREGEAARTIGYMLEDFPSDHPYAVYWRGALYIRQYDIVIRIPLSSQNYQVIELPEVVIKSILCAIVRENQRMGCIAHCLMQISWILKCDVNLHPLLENFTTEHSDSPSDVHYANYDEDDRSNGEDVLEQSHKRCSLLGFHPNEKIVFIHTPLQRVVAYHFESSKIEDLGCLPKGPNDYIYLSFPYTPCLMRVFRKQVA